MPFKTFVGATGSGNVVFEGDVFTGQTSPDGKHVVLRFVTNDRGYACAAFGGTNESPLDAAGAKALRDELAGLVEQKAAVAGKFRAESAQKRFALLRENDTGPLILEVTGTDARFGTAYHRGDEAEMKKVIAEFDTVLKTIADAASIK